MLRGSRSVGAFDSSIVDSPLRDYGWEEIVAWILLVGRRCRKFARSFLCCARVITSTWNRRAVGVGVRFIRRRVHICCNCPLMLPIFCKSVYPSAFNDDVCAMTSGVAALNYSLLILRRVLKECFWHDTWAESRFVGWLAPVELRSRRSSKG